MKKLLIAATALLAIGVLCPAANAGIVIGASVAAPVYAAPAPVYAYPAVQTAPVYAAPVPVVYPAGYYVAPAPVIIGGRLGLGRPYYYGRGWR